MDIFHSWIFFIREYFSGVDTFQGWTFLNSNLEFAQITLVLFSSLFCPMFYFSRPVERYWYIGIVFNKLFLKWRLPKHHKVWPWLHTVIPVKGSAWHEGPHLKATLKNMISPHTHILWRRNKTAFSVFLFFKKLAWLGFLTFHPMKFIPTEKYQYSKTEHPHPSGNNLSQR